MALSIIQRNIRKWLGLKNWLWWKLYTRVKPLLSMARAEDEVKRREEEHNKTVEELAKMTRLKQELEVSYTPVEQPLPLPQISVEVP